MASCHYKTTHKSHSQDYKLQAAGYKKLFRIPNQIVYIDMIKIEQNIDFSGDEITKHAWMNIL